MGHEGKLSRQAVNLSLPADLVQRAQACSPDLDGTVEKLLAGYVAREEARQQAGQPGNAALYEGLNRLIREHGTVADELTPL